jgi:amino acid adenylation domain-containing protein
VRLSYGEWNAASNRLARSLVELTRPNDRVAVLLERSQLQPITWLAITKAGLTYAPIDPGNPEARLRFLLDDIEPAIVVCQRSIAELIPTKAVRLLVLDDPGEVRRLGSLPSGNLERDPAPESAASLLYTSGSTGDPKAAVTTHRGLANFRLGAVREFPLRPSDRVLQLSPTSFDGAVFDYLLAFFAGATAVIPSAQDVSTSPKLARFLADARITVFAPTPSRLRDLPPLPMPDLRWIIAIGEPLPAAVVARWGDGRQISNGYGPTECSIISTVDHPAPDDASPPIGRLFPNFKGVVVDAAGRIAPVGVPGDLYLGGPGVGAGYWRRPDLTRERFVSNVPAFPGAPFYATGDLARWRPDGRLECLGRRDSQVKFHGARVELGEIEAALASHPAVRNAAVILQGEQLRAWIEGEPPGPDIGELRDWVGARIQTMFIPSTITWLPSLPRTVSGKINRPALAAASDASNDATQRAVARGIAPTVAFDLVRSVVDRVQACAASAPDAVAIEWEGGSLRYRDLVLCASDLAARLLADGLQPEDPVALILPRGPDLAVAALAVLMASGSYVPLDPDSPPGRLEFQLRDCGARRAVAPAGTAPPMPGVKVLSTTHGAGVGPTLPAHRPPPTQRAYLIYTSGSTGRPKAVEIEHHSLTNLVCHYHRRLGFDASTRASLIAHPTFDASVADLWPALCAGGAVVVPPAEIIADPDGLIAWLAAKKITFTFVPTAMAALMFGRPWPSGLSLRHFLTGGEALHGRPPAGLAFEVLNTYGPTENTVDSTWAVLEPSNDPAPPPIGRPISNVRAYVLDDGLRPLDVGAEGELFLGGEGIARGYLGRPELTGGAFLPDPFSESRGARMYRTGDRVRWNADGELEFLGRRDGQVQIAGRRVELGEIEACLRAEPGVTDVVCLPVRDDVTVRGVIAHVEAGAAAEPLREALARRLGAELPGYMRPAEIKIHAHLPRTAAGKIDRAALTRAVVPSARTPVPTDADAPLETKLSALWNALLPSAASERAGASFWDLGGDSLAAVQLSLGVQKTTGRRISVASLLQEPTFDGMVRAVRRLLVRDEPEIAVMRETGRRRPLFCLYIIDGDVGPYLQLASALGPDQPVYGVRSKAVRDPAALPESMEKAAVDVIAQIRRVTGDPAPALLGFSWSGLLAFEVARQWPGDAQPFIGMIGTHSPIRRLGFAGRAGHFLRWTPPWLWRAAKEKHYWLTRLSRFFDVVRRAKATLGPEAAAGPAIPDWATDRIVQGLIRIGFDYHPRPSRPVNVHLFRETSEFGQAGKPFEPHDQNHLWDAGWTRCTLTPPIVHWIPGSHRSIMSPPEVRVLAAELRAAMDAHYRE